MRGITFALTALLGLAAGCSLPGVPDVSGEPQEDTTQQDAQGAPEAPSYAGTWTRQGEAALAFDVTDDGTKVHGELSGAEGHGFSSYTFDLARRGDGLEGAARFALADLVDKTYETKWQVQVAGTTFVVKTEELSVYDDGEVAERAPIEHTYDFAPSAPPAAAAYTPPAMDMSAYVTPAPNYKHLLTDDTAVGQWVEVEMDAMGNKSVTRTAVVADAGDAWVVEVDNQMSQKDLLLAVFVHKDTGDVLKAYVGDRGKAGTEKAVSPPPAAQAGEAPPVSEEEVSVPAGTFMATRTDMSLPDGSTVTTWVGMEGTAAEGVVLKTRSAAGTDELKELEETAFEAAGAAFEARRLVYTSGNETILALSPRPHLNQLMLLTRMSGVSMRLAGQGEDAAPAFDYPR